MRLTRSAALNLVNSRKVRNQMALRELRKIKNTNEIFKLDKPELIR